MIFVYTCVYNSEKTLADTIESVLGQSRGDFEYHIEDNGSTDGTRAILYDYADRDSRVIPHIREKNHTLTGEASPLFAFVPPGQGYLTTIDGDDWWEPDYLERLLAFAEQFDLDIACTGTLMHDMATGETGSRRLPRPLVLAKRQFAEALPYYHAFFRPVWGKLVRTELISRIHIPTEVLNYGTDTVYSFQLLRAANRIGIDSSTLHHYRVSQQSASYRYDPKRFVSDVCLYEDAVNFLSAFGPVSAQNRLFLQKVYSHALTDTIGVVYGSALPPADKLREYHTIAGHPLTQAAYRECKDESALQSRKVLLLGTLQAGTALNGQEERDLRAVAQYLAPRCGQAVSAANAKLFLEDPKLLQALFLDDAETLMRELLKRMGKNQAVRKYPLPETIQALAADNALLCQISDSAFLNKYAEIYQLVWQGEHLSALEKMTGILLENQAGSGQETFLQLYISLGAFLEEAPAFIYGKLKLAQLYFRQRRLPECRAIVSELKEIGLTDNEELNDLEYRLKKDQ